MTCLVIFIPISFMSPIYPRCRSRLFCVPFVFSTTCSECQKVFIFFEPNWSFCVLFRKLQEYQTRLNQMKSLVDMYQTAAANPRPLLTVRPICTFIFLQRLILCFILGRKQSRQHRRGRTEAGCCRGSFPERAVNVCFGCSAVDGI